MYNWGNLNPYIYTYQNPVKWIDPNGKQVISFYITGYDNSKRLNGFGGSYDMQTKQLTLGSPNFTLNYNFQNNTSALTNSGNSVVQNVSEMGKSNGLLSMIPNFAVDYFVDKKIDSNLMFEFSSQIDKGLNKFDKYINSDTKSIIRESIISNIGTIKNDLVEDNADLIFSEAADRYYGDKKFSKGLNTTLKYNLKNGGRLFIRYTDWDEKENINDKNVKKNN